MIRPQRILSQIPHQIKRLHRALSVFPIRTQASARHLLETESKGAFRLVEFDGVSCVVERGGAR